MLPANPRYLLLTEGQSHPTPAKMAAGLLRYRPESVVAILDSASAGQKAKDLFGVGGDIPVVGGLQEAASCKPNALVIGITPAGGRLPPEWRGIIIAAIRQGLDIISGMHSFLTDDAEFVELADRHGTRLVDLRKPPDDLSVNLCRAAVVDNFRIHTVGSDCNCGKKVTAIEIDRALREMGKDSVFIATGQSGILITGKGIAMDHVVSDFVSGTAERLVLENSEFDFQVIEGQGAITHPLYSGVTLSMLHGFVPHVLILCHQADRRFMRGTPDMPVPPLELLIDLYESVAQPIFPTKVVAVSLNTFFLTPEQARREIDRLERLLRLPATDVVRFGAGKIMDAILDFEKTTRRRGA
jgi:uncharacterized NAD-dependent epimerase/dehydratase family protein